MKSNMKNVEFRLSIIRDIFADENGTGINLMLACPTTIVIFHVSILKDL